LKKKEEGVVMGAEKVADDMINSTTMMLEHVMAVAIELQKHAATQKKKISSFPLSSISTTSSITTFYSLKQHHEDSNFVSMEVVAFVVANSEK
jgi:hypothetical protein